MIDSEGEDASQKVFDLIDPYLTIQSERDLLKEVTGIGADEGVDPFDMF